MFRKYQRRSTFSFFAIFRLILSGIIFLLLFVGLYSSYKHFAGIDPFSFDAKSLLITVTSLFPKNLGKYLPLPQIKDSKDILSQINFETGSNQTKKDRQNDRELFSFVLVADSHSDNANLKKALNMAKVTSNPEFLIGLGDYTEVGTLTELENAKAEFDQSGIRYFLTTGDHDLWDSRDKQKEASANFRQVFGPAYQSFDYENFKFILLFNSDNYSGIDQKQWQWMLKELDKAKDDNLAIFIFLHIPLFHPSSDHVMGRVEPKLKDQARELIQLFSEYGVKKIFAGDTHVFSEYIEPETNLSMVSVGATTSERNLQLPRFARVWVFKDGEVKVEDVEIK